VLAPPAAMGCLAVQEVEVRAVFVARAVVAGVLVVMAKVATVAAVAAATR